MGLERGSPFGSLGRGRGRARRGGRIDRRSIGSIAAIGGRA
jgi:hypothetical protein